MNKKLLAAAITGLTLTSMAPNAMASSANYTHCKGVALKKMNDCGAKGHGCAGKAAADFIADEWVKTANQADCDAIKKAIKNPAVKKYLQAISNKINS